MGGHAWVTLATNDSYSLGALVLAHSLKQVGTRQQLAVLITPGVTGPMRSKLSEVFNVVVEVNLLDSKDETNLRLLKRPELGVTFTKLHCWRLTQFDKCVFLDADTLVLENCDELFDREELSAAPDIGWPDCFNSGVFVFRPSMETHEKLIQFALEKGSFDGGDQGLLNLYFSDWAHKDISKHLPFIYNMASTACYSYLPAFKQFGKSAKIIHFIGASKPWLQYFDTETRRVHPAEGVKHLQEILQLWWNIFCNLIHPGLSPQMAGLAGAFAQLTLGSARTAEQQALDDHLRRQGWEVGNIDYMGRDSFENIWNKICQTLSSAPEQTTTIKEPSSPKAGSKPAEDLPVEVKSDERSVEVASSEVQPMKEVVEAEPVEKLSTAVPQEDKVSQPIETPVAATPESQSCNKITVTEKIEQAKPIATTNTVESKTEAQATELTPAPVKVDVEVPLQPAQVETPTPAAQTQDRAVSTELTTPKAETQPVAEKPALEIHAAPVPDRKTSPVQDPEVLVATVPEPSPVSPDVPVAPFPQPSPVKSPEVPVATVPEPSSVRSPEVPVAPVPQPSPEVPVAPAPEPSPVQVPEIPLAPVLEPSIAQAPEIPAALNPEPSQPCPVQPPPSPADPLPATKCPTSATPVTSGCEPPKLSPVQPTLESETVKESSTPVATDIKVLEKPQLPVLTANIESAAVESPTPATVVPHSVAQAPKLATEPQVPSSVQPKKSTETFEPRLVTCPAKKPSGKLNVTATVKEPAVQPATPKVPSAVAPKLQAQVTAPSPPTTPASPQPEQVKVAKEALKVETSVPATPPPDAQQTSTGPTPPPRKSSGGTKKATKPKK